MSELLVLEVLLQLALQDASQLLKVLCVQTAVAHQLHTLQGGERQGRGSVDETQQDTTEGGL